jgi:hypothetical protein
MVGQQPGVDPERPLEPLLLFGQRSRQDFRTLLDAAKGQRQDRTGAADERSEREGRERLAARAIASRFRTLLDDIAVLEADCLPEIGQPHVDDELVHRWRRLINSLGDLGRLCSDELPGLERKLCGLLIDHRIRLMLEPRLERIVDIVEQEKEDDAVEILQERFGPEAAPTETADSSRADAGLIQDWMLGRYMIRELATVHGLNVLRWLTSWKFVAMWIALPFVLCALLHLAGLDTWRGVPFAVTCVGNVVLLAAFAIEAKHRLPQRGGIGVSVWRFLLPQTTAAIFLAAFSSIPSDERWSLTVKGNLPVAVITWAVFLVVGFVFIREIILGNQFRGRGERILRNRRTAQVMSLSLWQAFVLAMFFTMTVGRIMGAGDRGNIDPEAFVGMGRWIRQLLPIEVHLGSWFLEPAASRETAIFWVHPRAIVSWTIQMFFFGAIFERIMGRSEA